MGRKKEIDKLFSYTKKDNSYTIKCNRTKSTMIVPEDSLEEFIYTLKLARRTEEVKGEKKVSYITGSEGLRDIREYLEVTRRQLEARIPEVGQGYLANVELGIVKNPSYYNMYCIANGLCKVMRDKKIDFKYMVEDLGQNMRESYGAHYPILDLMQVIILKKEGKL